MNMPLTRLPVAVQPRARGDAILSVKPRDGRTVLDVLRQAGSLKLLFPRVQDAGLQAVVVNTAGGITGGDRFQLSASVGPGCRLTMTTQAAERAYRAQPGETGHVRTRLDIGEAATLHWLPQETMLFQGASLQRHIGVHMAPTARLLLCEPVIFGRAAMGEVLSQAAFSDRIEIVRDGQRVFLDAVQMKDDIAAQLADPVVADGAGAMASLILVAPEAETHLEPVRAALGASGGASLLKPDVLFVRLLAKDGFLLRRTLIPILTRLSGASLPRPWMI